MKFAHNLSYNSAGYAVTTCLLLWKPRYFFVIWKWRPSSFKQSLTAVQSLDNFCFNPSYWWYRWSWSTNMSSQQVFNNSSLKLCPMALEMREKLTRVGCPVFVSKTWEMNETSPPNAQSVASGQWILYVSRWYVRYMCEIAFVYPVSAYNTINVTFPTLTVNCVSLATAVYFTCMNVRVRVCVYNNILNCSVVLLNCWWVDDLTNSIGLC